MPLYSYRCERCEDETEAFNRVAERHTHAPVCGKNATHGQMGIKLNPNLGYVQGDCHYICPMTKQQVTSHRQRNYIMKERNVIDANDFKPAASFERAEKEKAKDAELIRSLKKDLTTGRDRAMTEQQFSELIPSMGTP